MAPLFVLCERKGFVMSLPALPLPTLEKQSFPVAREGANAPIEAYTDAALLQACGVRIAFTTRSSGVSGGAYESLNLGSHVDDNAAAVAENRARLCQALAGRDDTPLVVPNQVHGDVVLTVPDASPETIADVRQAAADGADAVVVSTAGVAANLCFADCCPLIAVAPTGAFAVIHAGWRGVDNLISVKAVRTLAQQLVQQTGVSAEEALANINVYIGAHIHAECFETGTEVHKRFIDQFGAECAYDETHIDLNYCLRKQLTQAGIAPERIADVGKCTVCCNDEFFSYRAQDGIAGRHGALAYREP